MCNGRPVNPVVDEDSEATRLLREERPNVQNAQQLLKLLETTRPERRTWIKSASPSITEILRKYPRLQDFPEAVCFIVAIQSLIVALTLLL
jgi:hypothetical protein